MRVHLLILKLYKGDDDNEANAVAIAVAANFDYLWKNIKFIIMALTIKSEPN